jgi:hypothetical protein
MNPAAAMSKKAFDPEASSCKLLGKFAHNINIAFVFRYEAE